MVPFESELSISRIELVHDQICSTRNLAKRMRANALEIERLRDRIPQYFDSTLLLIDDVR